MLTEPGAPAHPWAPGAASDVAACAAVIGVFDGVHRGHQTLLRTAGQLARRVEALTFDPPPGTLRGAAPELLCSLERRIELLRAYGADEVRTIHFDADVAATQPEAWIDATLRPLGVTQVVGGCGFRFGVGARGTAATLREAGIVTTVVPLLAGISSTQVRALLRAGDVEGAAEALGRLPELEVIADGLSKTGPRALRAAAQTLIVPADGAYEADSAWGRLVLEIEAGGAVPRLRAHGTAAALLPTGEMSRLRLLRRTDTA